MQWCHLQRLPVKHFKWKMYERLILVDSLSCSRGWHASDDVFAPIYAVCGIPMELPRDGLWPFGRLLSIAMNDAAFTVTVMIIYLEILIYSFNIRSLHNVHHECEAPNRFAMWAASIVNVAPHPKRCGTERFDFKYGRNSASLPLSLSKWTIAIVLFKSWNGNKWLLLPIWIISLRIEQVGAKRRLALAHDFIQSINALDRVHLLYCIRFV